MQLNLAFLEEPHRPDRPQPPSSPPWDRKAASALGVAPSTLHRLLNDGIIAGEQLTPGAPWRIRLTDDLIAIFNNNDAGDCFLPMREAMRALGVSRRPCCNVSSAASSKPVMSSRASRKACASR